MLISVEKTADSQLGELAGAINVTVNEWVGVTGVGLSVDWKRCFAGSRSSVEIWEDIIAVVRLVLGILGLSRDAGGIN